MNKQFEQKLRSQLKNNEIDWQTDVEDQEESGYTDYELILKDESGFTCKLYVEVKEEKNWITEDFGLGNETHEFIERSQEITNVEDLIFYDSFGEEIKVSEDTEKRIIKYIKTGK